MLSPLIGNILNSALFSIDVIPYISCAEDEVDSGPGGAGREVEQGRQVQLVLLCNLNPASWKYRSNFIMALLNWPLVPE